MTGESLKAQILKIEPTMTEVAKKLQISKQSLHQALSVADVKTGFIERLASIYGCPVSFFFGERNKIEIKENEHSFDTNADVIIRRPSKYNDDLEDGDQPATDAFDKTPLELRMEIKHLRALLAEKDALLSEKDARLAEKERIIRLLEQKL